MIDNVEDATVCNLHFLAVILELILVTHRASHRFVAKLVHGVHLGDQLMLLLSRPVRNQLRLSFFVVRGALIVLYLTNSQFSWHEQRFVDCCDRVASRNRYWALGR